MAPKVVSPLEEFLPWAIRPLAKRFLRPNKKSQVTRESFLSNPFLKFFSPSQTKETPSNIPKKEFYKFTKLENISVEYLEIICKNFTPRY